MLLGLFGAALFLGETVLTPAISVVSAIEGLQVGTPLFERWVLPLSVLVLLGLFALQRLGTAKVGALFGPVCLLWFLALGAVGIWNIWLNPGVLAALDPRHAYGFVTSHALRFVRRARRGAARLHRHRVAVRGHGPFRQVADPHRAGSRWCCRRWCSTTSGRARC